MGNTERFVGLLPGRQSPVVATLRSAVLSHWAKIGAESVLDSRRKKKT
jgi:hypothetical protein